MDLLTERKLIQIFEKPLGIKYIKEILAGTNRTLGSLFIQYDIYKSYGKCGEKRATQYCHIVPRMIGGASAEENYIYLCPTHHSLFDSNRLSSEEWAKIDFTSKSNSARAYAKKYGAVFTGEKNEQVIYSVRLEDFGMVARKRGLPISKGDPRLKRLSKKAKTKKTDIREKVGIEDPDTG